MNAIRDAIEPEAETVIGTTKVLIENHVSKCSAEECNGGNMFADAVFDHFSDPPVSGVWSQINAVVVNAGSFVKSFDERVNGGEVRLVDLFDMYPYDNPYVLVTMQGDTLRAMMEHSINTDVGHADKFLQISGMRVQYDRNADVGSRVKQLSILCTACRTPSYQRVIKIQWYTVAMPRFIAGGGGGYDFSRVPRGYKIDSNITDGHILQKYLKKHSPLMPMLDGRITFTSGAPESPAALWDLGRAACVRLLLLFGGVYCSMLKH
ncbi:protein 5NUC-like [Haemaphysalis longicornis]